MHDDAPLPETAPSIPPAPRGDVPWSSQVVNVMTGKGLVELMKRKLMKRMMTAIEEWSLVAPGDRIMVALSGGKDSYTLFDLLTDAQRRAPFSFELIGVHLDQMQPGYEPEAFYAWLEAFGAPYEIVREDTYSVVTEKTKPGQAYCFICSRLRRGVLYSVAERLGCNKIALGHHRDDAIETLLMNLFFAGKMQAMPARYTTDDGRFTVIRPLIECGEKEIAEYAAARAFPVLPCNLCGSQDGLKREEMARLMSDLETRFPDVRQVMLHAMKNIRPTHMLDKDVVAAWEERPEGLREMRGMKAGDREAPWRHKAETVLKGGSNLLRVLP